MIPAID